jgi:hypothetical protein
MLFAEPVQCLAEATAEVGKSGDSDEWLSEVNLLYCWKDRECADTSKWNFDIPNTGPTGGGIQFKPSPNPTGQTVGGDAKRMIAAVPTTAAATGAGAVGTAVGEKAASIVDRVKNVESDVVNKAEGVVDTVKGVADKAEDVVNKVQDATDKVHDVSNRLKEVEKIAKDVIPFVIEEIPVVGPAITAAERIAVRVGLWTKILHRGVDVLEGLLNRLKGLIEKAKPKDPATKDTSAKDPNTKDPNTKDPNTKDPNTKDPGSKDPEKK